MDEQPRPRSKVVVVDDDAVAGDQIRGLLEAAGYDVSVIGNGEEALEVARTEPPRLVVLDVCLPGISGLRGLP
jgi:DNA-binding response OmpR family regulator